MQNRINNLVTLLDFCRREAGLKPSDPRGFFNKLKTLKDNTEKTKSKNGERETERVLEDGSLETFHIDTIVNAINKIKQVATANGIELKFDSKFQAIRERDFDTATDKEIPIVSGIKDPTLKYVWITGTLKTDPIDLVITRYARNSNYRIYHNNQFYRDATSPKELQANFMSLTKLSGSVDPLEKVLGHKKSEIDSIVRNQLKDFEPKVKWESSIAKPTDKQPTYRLGVLLFPMQAGDKFDEDTIATIKENIEPIRKTVQDKLTAILTNAQIDPKQLEIDSKILESFETTPGFIVSMAVKTVADKESAAIADLNKADMLKRIISEYRSLKI